MIYSIHTVYNGGERDGAEHYLSAETRLGGLRARVIDLGEMTEAEAESLGEEELCAAMNEILSPTKGNVSLTEAAMDDVAPEPATLKQLFILDTQNYESFTSLHRSTEALTETLIGTVLDTEGTFFSADVRAEVLAVITRGRTEITASEDIHATLLAEVRDVLEDGPYAVYVHDVTLPA